MGDVTRMERVGEHIAIDFVNTLGGLPEDPHDEYLHDYADLVTFAEGSSLLTAPAAGRLRQAGRAAPEQATKVLRQALRLRSSLDRVLRAHLADRPAADDDLDAVRRAYGVAVDHAALRREDDNYQWAWPAEDTLEQPLWLLAASALELLHTAPLRRLGRCAHCRWLFLDTTKNHSRRWCSMNSCGSIIKMRRYRASHRGRARGSTSPTP